jgi:hypothetical protein
VHTSVSGVSESRGTRIEITDLLREKRRRSVREPLQPPRFEYKPTGIRVSQMSVGENFSFSNTTRRRYPQTFETESNQQLVTVTSVRETQVFLRFRALLSP